MDNSFDTANSLESVVGYQWCLVLSELLRCTFQLFCCHSDMELSCDAMFKLANRIDVRLLKCRKLKAD